MAGSPPVATKMTGVRSSRRLRRGAHFPPVRARDELQQHDDATGGGIPDRKVNRSRSAGGSPSLAGDVLVTLTAAQNPILTAFPFASPPPSIGAPFMSKASYFMVDVKVWPSAETVIRSTNTPRPDGSQPAPFMNSSAADGAVA